MKCIICQNEMETKRRKELEIDLCRFCGGVWLDAGEFERLSGVDSSEYRILRCINCDTSMVTRSVYGVEIDICPECGAVWLDNGELDKIVGLNPFGEFGKNEFRLFRDVVLISREIEKIAKPRPQGPATEPMYINDLFLVYKDGCLITHKTRRLMPEMDDEILSAMLLAIQHFISDSFKDEADVALKQLSFGESQILIERGKYTFIAAVVGGKVHEDFPKQLKQTITEIEEKYAALLGDWHHQYDDIRGAQDIIARLLLE